MPPVVWSQTSNAIISTNGRNMLTITHSDPAAFDQARR
jgi:hypothetical protein